LGACGYAGKGRRDVIAERQHIKDAIYDWVAAVLAEEGRTDPVIWDDDDGPRPEAPFISLTFTGTSTPGLPNYSMVEVDPEKKDDPGTQTISRFVRRSLTMYAFGERAMDLLETIKASIDKETYILMLAKKGLVIPEALEVRENPAVYSGSTEEATIFEFFVTYTRITTDSPGWIETVDITPEGIPMEAITNKPEEENDG
jgi:hypothetical protein